MTDIQVVKLIGSEKIIVPGTENIKLLDIPNGDKQKRQFESLFVIISVLRNALRMVESISPYNNTIVNRALFITSLIELVKCFCGSDKYSKLSPKKLKKKSNSLYEEFERYRNLRNEYYVHMENDMVVTSAYVPFSIKEGEYELAGLPSVIVDFNEIDYLTERGCLIWVISNALEIAKKDYDAIGDKIIERYKGKPKEEIKVMQEVRLKVARQASYKSI